MNELFSVSSNNPISQYEHTEEVSVQPPYSETEEDEVSPHYLEPAEHEHPSLGSETKEIEAALSCSEIPKVEVPTLGSEAKEHRALPPGFGTADILVPPSCPKNEAVSFKTEEVSAQVNILILKRK